MNKKKREAEQFNKKLVVTDGRREKRRREGKVEL